MELFHTARPWLHSWWPQWRRWIVGARCVRRIQTSIIADQSKCIHGGELYKYRPDLTKIWRHTNFHNKSIGISFTDSTFGLSCILLAFAFMFLYIPIVFNALFTEPVNLELSFCHLFPDSLVQTDSSNPNGSAGFHLYFMSDGIQ
jgi:hypothetical protein